MVRRDVFLLPLVVVATLLVLLIPAELFSRAYFQSEEVDSCQTSSALVVHGKPGCVSRTKAPEGPWVVNRYNECGYRTPEPCGPKPPGSLRVAVVGASTSAGYLTPYDQSMAAVAAKTLTRLCGRPVEFQNLGEAGNYGSKLVASAQEALTLKPDLIVLVIAPIDFERMDEQPSQANGPQPALNIVARLKNLTSFSRLLYMEQYFILQHDGIYVPIFLRSGEKPDFMRSPLPPAWSGRLLGFEVILEKIAKLTRGVKTVLLFVPQRAQAALAASGNRDQTFDPELLPDSLSEMAGKAGMSFVNGTRSIPTGTSSSQFFYAINGHPNGLGHAAMADGLVHQMLSPGMEPFGANCSEHQ